MGRAHISSPLSSNRSTHSRWEPTTIPWFRPRTSTNPRPEKPDPTDRRNTSTICFDLCPRERHEVIVGPDITVRRRKPKVSEVLITTMLLTALSSAACRGARAYSRLQVERQPASSAPLVIQGRITEIQGALLTVKTPDGYPGGGPGVHAQFVTAGPAFKVDISRARVLLPDGRQADRVPLAVGDRVLAVLTGTDSDSSLPDSVSHTYLASVVERVVQTDKIVSH